MNRIKMHACMGLVFGVVSISPALAQESAGAAQNKAEAFGGDEIIVTARRKEEALQTVPVAVTALGGDALAKAQAVNLSDAVKLAPSLNVGTSSRGSSVPFVAIRGIASSDITPTIDPAIGIYVNEVVAGRPNGVLTSLYDVESVQILRGPQGTLFGRNTTGGAILITTRKPGDEFGGYFRGSLGNYGAVSVEGALNLPLSEAVRLRVAGRVNKRDGYVKSVYSGQDLSDINDQSARATLVIKPSDVLENTTVASYFHSRIAGQGSVSFGLFPVGAFTSNGTVGANNNIADAGNRAAVDRAGALFKKYFYRNATEPQKDYNRTFDIANTTRFEVSDSFQLKNIFGYRTVKSLSEFDYDASEAKVLQVNTYGTIKQISEELQALGNIGKLDYVLGGYYFKEWGRQLNPSFTAIPYALRLTPGSMGLSDASIRNKSYSVYLNLSYPITDTLKATVGGRYTWDKRFARLRNRNIINPTSASPTESCLLSSIISFTPESQSASGLPEYVLKAANPCLVDRSLTSKEPTYSVDLAWQATPDVLLYAAHRHGYHSGALNSRAAFTNAVVPDSAKPEFIDDAEVGVKAGFNLGEVRGHVNVAAYYGWLKDVQRSTSSAARLTTPPNAPATRLLSATINAAKAKISGVEVEYGMRYGGLELSGFYAYNRTKYDEYFDGVRDHSDDRFIYAPKHTFGVTGRYSTPIGNGPTEGVVQLNYYHTTSFATVYGQQPIGAIVPGYGLLNGRLELNDLAGGPVDVAFFVNNITDKKYLTGGSAVGQLGVGAYTPGAPRMYGVELHLDF